MPPRRSQSWEKFIDGIIEGENISPENVPTFEKQLCTDKTSLGQKFAFAYVVQEDVQEVVQKEARYKTLLYMDEKHRDIPISIDTASKVGHSVRKRFSNLDNSYSIPCCRDKMYGCYFDSKNGAIKHIVDRCKSLKNKLKDEKIRTRELIIPNGIDPQTVLQPGDYIRTSLGLGGFVNHDGIYVGRNQVIHVSNHSSSSFNAYLNKKASCARLGDLIPDFISTKDTRISILVYPIEFHTPKTIVLNAIDYATRKFRLGQYHLKEKNCQHFGALCCTGAERVEDKVAFRKLLKMKESLSNNLSSMVARHLSRRLGNKLKSTVDLLKEKVEKMLETGEKNMSPVINASWEEIYELIDLLKAAQVEPQRNDYKPVISGIVVQDGKSIILNGGLVESVLDSEAMMQALRKIREIRDRSTWIPLNNGIVVQNGVPVNLVGGLCLHTIV